MELSPAFKEAARRLVARRLGLRVAEVTGWDEVLLPPTGAYEFVEAAISYRLVPNKLYRNKQVRVFYYDGSFSDLMSEIVSLDGGR